MGLYDYQTNKNEKAFKIVLYIFIALYLLCLVLAILRELIPNTRELYLLKLIFQINAVLSLPVILGSGAFLLMMLFQEIPRSFRKYNRYKIYIEEAEMREMEIQDAKVILMQYREDLNKKAWMFLYSLVIFGLSFIFYWYWFIKYEH